MRWLQKSLWLRKAQWLKIILIGGFVLVLPGHQMDMVSEYSFDEQLNLVTIRLSERMGEGTDGNCEMTSRLFHSICSQGYLLYVKPYRTGGWVPSRKNPMDVTWTKELVEHDPRIPESHSVIKRQPLRKDLTDGKPKGRIREYEVNGKNVIIRSYD